MLDCLPEQIQFCVPSEYRAFYDFTGFAMRPPESVRKDGPVLIIIEGKDHFFREPLEKLSRKQLGDDVLFYAYHCATATNCFFSFATLRRDAVAAREEKKLPLEGFISHITVSSKTESDMTSALTKMRYCLALAKECQMNLSVSFKDLRSAVRH